MNSDNTHPSIERAVAFVKESLEKGLWPPGERMPSTNRLAKRAGVGSRSMTKAVVQLKAEGLINGVRRGTLRAGNGSYGAAPNHQEPRAKWLMKRTELEKDILEGVYAHTDKLPSVKELCFNYGTCFATMRKILSSLVADKVVRLHRGSYAFTMPQNPRFQQRIVFISYRVQSMQWSALNQGQYRVLDLLENECMRRQLKLEIVEMNFFDPADTRRGLASPAITAPTLGYFFDLWWFDNAGYRRGNLDLLKQLTALKRPVAILDEIGDFDLPFEFMNNPLIQVYRIQGKSAGGRIAQLLLAIGHRSTAYISWQHSQAYSRQRLEGIKDQFAHAGYPSGVTPLLNQKLNGPFDVLLISGFSEKLIRAVLSIDRTEQQTEEIYQDFLLYKKSSPAFALDRSKLPGLRKKMKSIADLYKRGTDKRYFNRMCLVAIEEATHEFSRLILSKMFEQALQSTDITAWICATDGIALEALPFLRGRGISVPKNMSVVGFDNLPVAALDQRLTSFDFNAGGFVHRMLNFILRPARPKGPHHHSAIEVDGIIIERETLGRAPETLS